MHTMNTFDIQFVYKRNNAVEPVDMSPRFWAMGTLHKVSPHFEDSNKINS